MLESAALARERSHRNGYVVFEEYGTHARPGRFLREAVARVLSERYPPDSPDDDGAQRADQP